MSLSLKPGMDDSSVQILNNFNYFQRPDKYEFFKLREHYQYDYPRDRADSERRARSIAEKLASIAE